MEVVVNEISELGLNELDDEWVEAIYGSELLEFGEYPTEHEALLEAIDLPFVFQNIMKSVDRWLGSEPTCDNDKSWATLTHQFPHQKLLALLAYYIDTGIKNVINQEQRDNAILASRVYYKLLLIPGCKAYNIYHSQLFARSLACLSFPKAMCDHEENYFNTKELTREVNMVIKKLSQFVQDLKAIIELLQLNSADMNFEDILSNLVDITGGAIVNRLNIDRIDLTNLSRVIYEMIDILLCDANRQPNAVAIRLLFKCLLPKLVSASTDSRSSNILIRASYVTYSGLLLSKYGKAALPGFIALLQHLCYTLDGLERAEVRTARVSLVVGLMSFLPKKSYRRIVKWLLELSTTSKISHRHIAMEILANLLSNEPEEISSNETPTEGANDTSPNNGEQQNEESSVQQSQTDSDPGEGPSTLQTTNESQAESVSTDDESSQDTSILQNNQDNELTEEDIANLLQQRSHTVPHAQILRAVYERVNDVSSTLRTRALVILADCVISERQPMKDAIKELNGSGDLSRLMAVCARSVCDERAAVRRAALPLLHRVIVSGDSIPSPTDLAILVGMCRDASILVRSAAIAALGELIMEKPTETVFDAFLTGPIHQLSDPENKVQDYVVSLVRNLLINRLQKYVSNDNEDPLPWMFLDGITRHNMRRHLQKACVLLVKSSTCISHRLVDILSTHLGAVNDERDLQCLVMLTSVARHVQYKDIGFVLQYYYSLAEDTQERDARLMPLTIELASTWSQFILGIERTTLRDHLVRRLAVAGDDGSRIGCATLAAQLDQSNLQWATELMQLCETRAHSGSSVSEWVRCADMALVSPTPPSPALMRLFLTALTNPPPEWSEAEVGACVAGAGRLCLRSRDAAANAAPALAALLRDPHAPLPARINSLLVLTDICIRYTCIVEPLLECVCGCLATGGPEALRRGAARALTRLLLAGYLRLRTPLYYRYCALLADDDQDVREPAEYYVTSCLTADAIYHHFVDCVLHYNKDESGNLSFDARQLIYDVMLQRMSLVQRLNIQCRLAREVLEHAADLTDEGDGEIPETLNAALMDTITVLIGPRMKLPKKPQITGDTADIDDLQERVTTNIVSHKMKRTVAEVVVPAVLRLHSRLRLRGGQVVTYLVRLATDLLIDYKQEIEELIENDEELVVRVQHFQENIGLEPLFGNARNLVTASAPPDPVTPRAPRKRTSRPHKELPRKRALRI